MTPISMINCDYFPFVVAAQRWNSHEEITHVQGQRRPCKSVGPRVAAAPCWSNFDGIPHVQGQRRSPSKMVAGANLHLESNPIPTRDAQRAQTKLVCTRTQRWHRDQGRTVSEHLLWVSGGLPWG